MGRRKVQIQPAAGERLRELLKENKKTQKWIAEAINVQPQHISNVIRGTRSLTIEVAQLIKEKAFPDIRVQWLMGLDDCKTEMELEAYKKAKWQENEKAEQYNDYIRRLYLSSLNIFGYGFSANGSKENLLCGQAVEVVNQKGETVGAVPYEVYSVLSDEIEHYAAYIIGMTLKENLLLVGTGKEKSEKYFACIDKMKSEGL